MSTEVKWNADREASFLYAVDLIRRDVELADAELAERLTELGRKLLHELDLSGMTGEQIRQHLVPLGVQVDTIHQVADTLLRKTVGGERCHAMVAPIAGLVTDAGTATDAVMKRLNAQMATALPPLHDRCNRYLQPLLMEIGRLTDPGLIPGRAAVVVVPALSTDEGSLTGGGSAYLLYNMASLEVLPEDPRPELPEPLRLAWMIAQLDLDLPIHSENLPRDATPLVAALAMLMPTLTAGESLELCRGDEATVALALRHWQVVSRGHEELAAIVLDWWSTYAESRPPMSVALGALLKMVE